MVEDMLVVEVTAQDAAAVQQEVAMMSSSMLTGKRGMPGGTMDCDNN